jgi:raffinose/stachyose/melibiose transport system permease protein
MYDHDLAKTRSRSITIIAIMSVLSLSALPLNIVYFFGQEHVIKGMMAGALK